MKPSLLFFLCMYLMACSPYKKVTLTMSDRLTKRWQGATEQMVVASVGSYTKKSVLADGYLLHFDYSYLLMKQPKNANEFQVKASRQQPGVMTPRSNNSPYNEQRSAEDSVIKRMDFYFDQSQHVQYVTATGFPDSVYYVKRKGSR